MFHKKHIVSNGLTLIELLAVIAISVLLLLLTVNFFSSFRNSQVLQGETSQALSVINKARSNTLNSKADFEYGVRVNADRLILFQGSVFASSTPTNEEYVLHSAVQIGSITLGGGGLDIIFDRLTGETANNGSFDVSLKADPTEKNILFISQTGATAQN
ncbi:MAG: type II secretion system protein [Parcubacteria group bacterium]|nr:type II secretion system protein [Parcubacteria group bacterium]